MTIIELLRKGGDVRTLIENKHGKVVVDDDVFKWAQFYRWYVSNGTKRVWGYKMHNSHIRGCLARMVMNAPDGFVVDHIDGNRLNNTRGNLRVCVQSENVRNSSIAKDNTSGFKGVCLSGKKWRAQIGVNRKVVCLGSFDDAKSAALAYDAAALKYFGQYAKTNFPCEGARSSCYA